MLCTICHCQNVSCSVRVRGRECFRSKRGRRQQRLAGGGEERNRLTDAWGGGKEREFVLKTETVSLPVALLNDVD